MADLERDTLVFRFPEIHPKAELTVSFIRTLRLPDDGKKYPLPPGLGIFPLRHVEDFKAKVPPKWSEHGGIMLPMYQSEALWIKFTSTYIYDRNCYYPFAVKVSAGKRSAVTGKTWSKTLRENDYLIIPEQPWIDGFVVENGLVKQFVAIPLGMGMTVEGQLSGKEEFGGIQIQVFPMKLKSLDKKFPVRPQQHYLGGLTRSVRLKSSGPSYGSSGFSPLGAQGPMGAQGAIGPTGSWTVNNISTQSLCSTNSSYYSANASTTKGISDTSRIQDCNDSFNIDYECNTVSDMGLGAGGSMVQQIFKDPHKLTDWDQSAKNRCYVHIVNTMVWQTITGSAPPTLPRTASDYSSHGLPWFDFYIENVKSHKGTKALKGVKTVAQMSKKKGIPVLPENQSANPKHVVVLGNVHDGKWE
jgi:hypothetical protein